MKIKNVKFTVLGFGLSGFAATKILISKGGYVFVSDTAEFKKDINLMGNTFELGGHSSKCLACDVMIVSPGIPLDIPIIKQAKKKKIEVISEIELGFRLKNKKSKIIAVTGTNGKSTVTCLIHHFLKTFGYKALLAGNIGYPLCKYNLSDNYDFIVLELSSFQIELLDTFKADTAIILNITPDHLNRYRDFDEYSRIKFNIFRNQTKEDLAIIGKDIQYPQTEAKIYKITKKVKLVEKGFIINGELIKNINKRLIGEHNTENIAFATLAIFEYTKDYCLLQKAISSFKPLEHRLELVRTVSGIVFINDSKATTVDSTICALKSFKKKVILILGGSEKGEDFTRLKNIIRSRVKKLYLIGKTGENSRQMFAEIADSQYIKDFSDVLIASYQGASKGDIILLSPASASYDMFKSYVHRGNVFKKFVKELKNV